MIGAGATHVVEVEHPLVDGAAGVRGEQLDRPLQGDQRQLRVDAALPALGRLAEQLVPAGGAARPSPGPSARPRAARRPCPAATRWSRRPSPRRARSGRSRRRSPCPRRRAPGRHRPGWSASPPARARRTTRPPLQPAQVEDVHRLAELEHHVVGDVDRQRDRPDAGRDQPALHPLGRRRGRVDAAHHAGGEPVAADGVLDPSPGTAASAVPPRRVDDAPGRCTATSNAYDSSRAMPRTLISYPRSGVISTSTTHVVEPDHGPRVGAGRGATPAGSTMMPEWSPLRPSSAAEQIMPLELRPYVLRAPILNPPGSSPPGRITTTRSPTAKLRAPQTISCGVRRCRRRRVQNRIGFLKPVSSSISSTRPTTRSPLTVAAWSTIDSTSMPRSTSGVVELGGGQPGGQLDVLPQPRQ